MRRAESQSCILAKVWFLLKSKNSLLRKFQSLFSNTKHQNGLIPSLFKYVFHPKFSSLHFHFIDFVNFGTTSLKPIIFLTAITMRLITNIEVDSNAGNYQWLIENINSFSFSHFWWSNEEKIRRSVNVWEAAGCLSIMPAFLSRRQNASHSNRGTVKKIMKRRGSHVT